MMVGTFTYNGKPRTLRTAWADGKLPIEGVTLIHLSGWVDCWEEEFSVSAKVDFGAFSCTMLVSGSGYAQAQGPAERNEMDDMRRMVEECQ